MRARQICYQNKRSKIFKNLSRYKNYKVLILTLAAEMAKNINDLCKRFYVSNDQLLYIKVIIQDCTSIAQEKDLFGWIDYKKAFDR